MDKIKLVHVDTMSCEAIFRIAPNGDYIIVCQCGDVREPAIGNKEYIFRSVDNGESWSDGTSIIDVPGRAVYATEVWVHDGLIDVFCTLHDGRFLNSENIVMRSRDNGKTFEKLRSEKKDGVLEFIRGVVTLENGSVLMPYQRYELSAETVAMLEKEDKLIMSSNLECVKTGTYLYKQFPGERIESNAVITPSVINGVYRWKWTEPTVAELSDGTLVMLLRVDGTGRLFKAVSCDGGKTWGKLEKTEIKNPGNKPKLIRLSNGKIALINTFNEKLGWEGRQPLSVWISDDDMNTWKYKRDIVKFDGRLSYPDGVLSPDGKHILFSFDFNRHDIYFVNHEIV